MVCFPGARKQGTQRTTIATAVATAEPTQTRRKPFFCAVSHEVAPQIGMSAHIDRPCSVFLPDKDDSRFSSSNPTTLCCRYCCTHR
jgi:hypothetical protein